MAYIYLHRRNDTEEVFYVGKGTGKRAYQKTERNQHWHNVVNKTGFSVEIIARGLTDEEAYWVEPLLIEAHGGVENLANITTGGEGLTSEEVKALWQDPAYREKISKARKEQWQDPERREKKSQQTKEQWQDPAYREKQSKAIKERMLEQWQDSAHREKISKASKEQMLQQWQDPAYREKMSKARKEEMLEQWQDPAYREKMSKTTKESWQNPAVREKRERKIECDKCGRMIGITVLPQHQRGSRCYNSDIDS